MSFVGRSVNMDNNFFDEGFFDELFEKRDSSKSKSKNRHHDQEQMKMVDFDDLSTLAENKIRKQQQKELKELKNRISSQLANQTTNKKLFGTTNKKEIAWLEKTIQGIIQNSGTELPRTLQKKLTREMLLEITSLGKIHELVIDKTITEIMVNAPDEVWIEREGQLILTDIKFVNEEEVNELANKIANNVGRSVNTTNPIVDARLPDGSRVHIVLPPISMKGTTITIRKFFQEKLTGKDLIAFKSITPEAAQFLEKAVKAKANIIVSGGTSSGKTTILNIVSNFVPGGERILTIEDSAELKLNNEHVVKMEARVANAEGKGEITIRDLVKAALRMAPKRIVVGEVRDGTAFDLLQAMNTGHDGSMATVHANDPDACISRLEALVLMAGTDMPSRAIRKNIANAVDIIVQTTKLSDGSRKITHITEVTNYDEEKDIVSTKDIYKFKKTGVDKNGKFAGKIEFTGHIASKYLQDKFEMNNLNYHEAVGLEKPEVYFE
ncbi:type II secretion system protein E [Bacillus thuringiensis]|uniref:Type II secretion system protein E n=2 Tax=Bacillus TaxID=1386 RepID=A0A9X6WIT8_BACTU|nr:type II secretion system protein E [Bacillus thuringiensis]PGP12758.1 type II secretion system protein E [Bacillus cereus]